MDNIRNRRTGEPRTAEICDRIAEYARNLHQWNLSFLEFSKHLSSVILKWILRKNVMRVEIIVIKNLDYLVSRRSKSVVQMRRTSQEILYFISRVLIFSSMKNSFWSCDYFYKVCRIS